MTTPTAEYQNYIEVRRERWIMRVPVQGETEIEMGGATAYFSDPESSRIFLAHNKCEIVEVISDSLMLIESATEIDLMDSAKSYDSLLRMTYGERYMNPSQLAWAEQVRAESAAREAAEAAMAHEEGGRYLNECWA